MPFSDWKKVLGASRASTGLIRILKYDKAVQFSLVVKMLYQKGYQYKEASEVSSKTKFKLANSFDYRNNHKRFSG